MTNTITYTEDGYGVGDRLLEGLKFDVTVDMDTGKVVTVAPKPGGDAKYFEQLNKEMWIERLRTYAQEIADEVFAAGSQDEVYRDLNPDGSIEY